jgi:hypothetical protein
MPKLRLGIGFEGVIHPTGFAAGDATRIPPERPVAGALRFLVDMQPHCELLIYPHRRHNGRAAAIQGWLVVETHRFFKAEGVSRDIREHVNALIDGIAITEHRPEADVTLELTALGCWAFPPWPGFAELAERAARLSVLERAAA